MSLPVAVINPQQMWDFAKAIGQFAETDVLDAHFLAHFAEVIRPHMRPLPNEKMQTLAANLTRRHQLEEMWLPGKIS